MKKIIDISEFQDSSAIDWDTLCKQIDGAIIRIGVTGYGSGETYYEDEEFETFYTELKKRNVPVGGYWYSCANELREGRAEAEFAYNLLKNKTFELPIYWDSEDQHHQQPLGRDELSKVGIEFLDFLEEKGYYVGVYASSNWLINELNMAMLSDYDVWVADYDNDPPMYQGSYGIWQYTSEGRLDGYDGNLDLNFMYKDYPQIIKSGGFNGFTKTNNTESKSSKKEEKKTRKMLLKINSTEEEFKKIIAEFKERGFSTEIITDSTAKKVDVNKLVEDIALGQNGWFNVFGEERKMKIKELGLDFDIIQKKVDEYVEEHFE